MCCNFYDMERSEDVVIHATVINEVFHDKLFQVITVWLAMYTAVLLGVSG